MKALFVVLNDSEDFDQYLIALGEKGLTGGTIFETQGMVASLAKQPALGSIFQNVGALLSHGQPFNRTLMMLLTDSQLQMAMQCLDEVVGDLNEANTGVMFTMPVDHYAGFSPE